MIPETSITFAGSFLDRADALRTDIPGLDAHMNNPASLTLPFWQGKPLFDLTPDGPRLAWVRIQSVGESSRKSPEQMSGHTRPRRRVP